MRKLGDIIAKIQPPICWACAIIVICVSIAGLSQASDTPEDFFIVTIALIIFAGIISVLRVLAERPKSTASKYDLESQQQQRGKDGEENLAYEKSSNELANRRTTDPTDDKWVKNYVPYGDYPAGKTSAAEVNGEGELSLEKNDGEKGHADHHDKA